MDLAELNKHLALVEKLHDAQEIYRGMEAKSLGAQKVTGMPHGTGVSDKVGMLAAELADMAARIEYLQQQVDESAAPIRAWTNTIEDEWTRMFFRYRYLYGYSWAEVAAEKKGLTEEAVKMVCYRYLEIVS